jgi:hypothetical protein
MLRLIFTSSDAKLNQPGGSVNPQKGGCINKTLPAKQWVIGAK